MPATEALRRRAALEWIAKGDTDLSAAKRPVDVNPAILYPACFHCQQAVEKYIKAILVYDGTAFPRTHDLEPLYQLLSPTQKVMMPSLAELQRLVPFAVELRYPGIAPEPSVAEARDACDLMLRVRAGVAGCLPFVPPSTP